MVTYHVIGQPIRRVDGEEKATGQARYAAAVSLPGTLWGKSLHSPYAHARLVRIATTAAKQVSGVHAVITGADVLSTHSRSSEAPGTHQTCFAGCSGRSTANISWWPCSTARTRSSASTLCPWAA
jgi:CO/xanthine dehydrogenase Mo-binding subunit